MKKLYKRMRILITSTLFLLVITIILKGNGLIADWHFNEGSGNIVYDSSGNNNHGMIYGVEWVAGKLGYGLQFDGIDDYLEINDSPSLDSIKNEITLIAWVKPNLDSIRGSIIARYLYDYNIPINERVFELDIDEDYSINFALSSNGTSDSTVWFSSSWDVRDTIWTHIAVTSDGTTMKIYIDGVMNPNTADALGTINISPYNLQIGTWEYSPGERDNYFKGIIDEVKIYSRALTQDEIIADFLEGASVGAITGRVTDKVTGNPIQDAAVRSYRKTTTTNTTGHYIITNIQIGDYAVAASKRGYQGELDYVQVLENDTIELDFQLEKVGPDDVILWDTNKKYTNKNPFSDALADTLNWTQVPYGVTNYDWVGDPMLENKHYYLFLFTNDEDSPCLAAKINGKYSQNEIYKVHDTGYRNFGHGNMWTIILKNTPEEIMVESAEKGLRFGPPPIPITTTYCVPQKPWLEVKPVENVNQQGMHAKSRLAAFVFENIERDVILDGRKHEEFEENIYPAAGCIGEINLKRSNSEPMGEDFMWFLTFPPGAETNQLTYQGIHYPDPYWEWDCKPCAPSVGANYAYLEEKVIIGVLNFGDNWKREDVDQYISVGEMYTSSFTAPYAGKWRICGAIDDDWNVTDYFSEVNINAGNHFTFMSPASGVLDYLVMYMWDRTTNTPDSIFTPMDVYREAILGLTVVTPELDRILVYPNPYRADMGWQERITFGNLPSEATIRIYSLSGKLVKEIRHQAQTSDGIEEWDISDVSSGVYIYLIKSRGDKKVGKLSIVK